MQRPKMPSRLSTPPLKRKAQAQSPRMVTKFIRLPSVPDESTSSLNSDDTTITLQTAFKSEKERKLNGRRSLPCFNDGDDVLSTVISGGPRQQSTNCAPVKNVKFADTVQSDPRPDIVLTRKEIQTLWWTRDQLKMIKSHALGVASFYRTKRPHVAGRLNNLLEQCMVPQYQESKILNSALVEFAEYTSLRGLELAVVEKLHKRRYKTRIACFRTQSGLTETSCTAVEKSNILAYKCKNRTQYAARFARIMGQLDANRVLDTSGRP